MQAHGNRLRRSISVFASGLWIASLFLPAVTFVFDVEPNLFTGWKVLTSGWITLLALQTGWLANLAFWVLVFALLSRAPSPNIVGWSAAALTLFSAHTIDLFARPDFYDVRSVHEGYYVWMLANLTLVALAVFVASGNRAATRRVQPEAKGHG